MVSCYSCGRLLSLEDTGSNAYWVCICDHNCLQAWFKGVHSCVYSHDVKKLLVCTFADGFPFKLNILTCQLSEKLFDLGVGLV